MTRTPTTFDDLLLRIPMEYRGDFIAAAMNRNPSDEFREFLSEDAICQASLEEARQLLAEPKQFLPGGPETSAHR